MPGDHPPYPSSTETSSFGSPSPGPGPAPKAAANDSQAMIQALKAQGGQVKGVARKKGDWAPWKWGAWIVVGEEVKDKKVEVKGQNLFLGVLEEEAVKKKDDDGGGKEGLGKKKEEKGEGKGEGEGKKGVMGMIGMLGKKKGKKGGD